MISSAVVTTAPTPARSGPQLTPELRALIVAQLAKALVAAWRRQEAQLDQFQRSASE